MLFMLFMVLVFDGWCWCWPCCQRLMMLDDVNVDLKNDRRAGMMIFLIWLRIARWSSTAVFEKRSCCALPFWDMSTLLTYVGYSFRDRLIHPLPVLWHCQPWRALRSMVDCLRKEAERQVATWELSIAVKVSKDGELGTMGAPQSTKMDRILGILMDSGIIND